MVEAPRIRITYEKIRHIKGKIIDAGGATYKKISINLVGYHIKDWWYAGKYIYTKLVKGNSIYVIRTHMMMYGKILVNQFPANSKLIPFLILETNDHTVLRWYLSQIKILDPNCDTDLMQSNYVACSSKKLIEDSVRMALMDVSNENYQFDMHWKLIKKAVIEHSDEIVTDLLLNQAYFPGIGNILQQEVLYRCRILPMKKLSELTNNMLLCLLNESRNLVQQLYQSYLDRLTVKPHKLILQIYRKGYCPLGHKTIRQHLGYHDRRTTWCPICQK